MLETSIESPFVGLTMMRSFEEGKGANLTLSVPP